MKLELFVMTWKDSKASFESTGRSVVFNLNHIVKIVPVDDNYSAIFVLGDNEQYHSGHISRHEFELKIEG